MIIREQKSLRWDEIEVWGGGGRDLEGMKESQKGRERE